MTPFERYYTVVGIYLDDNDPETNSYVAWVEAIGPESAIEKVVEMDASREEATVVAVFEGHHSDVGGLA